MGTRYSTILTDKEIMFVAFDTTLDQFISPATASLNEAVTFGGGFHTKASVKELVDSAKKNVYDLRSGTIHVAVRLLAKLKCGNALSVPEACIVANFYRFLKATVAPHQYTYITLDAMVARSRNELGFDKKFPEYDDWELVTDLATYPAFIKKDFYRRYPKTRMPCQTRTLKSQLKLAGRYVGTLAIIANIAGPGKSSPKAIV